jgi:hypothetical protein
MESTANLGLFAVHKIVSEYAERICVHGEDAKSHKTVYISVNINTNFIFLDSFYLHYIGWIKPKNHLTLLSL